MKAWQVTQHGEPEEVLELADIPLPEPGPGQIRVRVLAAAANFPDVLLCRGTYQVKVPMPFTLGVELCGEVVAVAPDVTCFAPGDRVIGDTALPHGAFAQYALMGQYDFLNILEAPDEETMAKAAIMLASRGTMRTTTLPAIPVDQLIARLKADG